MFGVSSDNTGCFGALERILFISQTLHFLEFSRGNRGTKVGILDQKVGFELFNSLDYRHGLQCSFFDCVLVELLNVNHNTIIAAATLAPFNYRRKFVGVYSLAFVQVSCDCQCSDAVKPRNWVHS